MVASFRFCHTRVFIFFFILLKSNYSVEGATSSWRKGRETTNQENNNNLRGGSGRQLEDSSVTGRIIGGSVVEDENRYPYYVSLVSWDWRHVCGGSLIVSDFRCNSTSYALKVPCSLTSNV
jgi:hypothetical protein